MDSRQMYQATNHLSSIINWDKDWIHFGTEEQIKFDLIEKLIDDNINSQDILFIQERTNSKKCDRSEIIDLIRPSLGKKNFQIWTMTLEKVIEFNKIGVLRLGQK